MYTNFRNSSVLSTIVSCLTLAGFISACEPVESNSSKARSLEQEQQQRANECLLELEGATIGLWPPNHKMHSIGIQDCVPVAEECEDLVRVMFTRASSDEPVNDKGDGNHEPDILVDSCEAVQVRAERAGPKNGRFYTLEWLAENDQGERAEGSCQVIVGHDKGPKKQPVDDGPAYTIEIGDDFDDCDEAEESDTGEEDTGEEDTDTGEEDTGEEETDTGEEDTGEEVSIIPQ